MNVEKKLFAKAADALLYTKTATQQPEKISKQQKKFLRKVAKMLFIGEMIEAARANNRNPRSRRKYWSMVKEAQRTILAVSRDKRRSPLEIANAADLCNRIVFW